MSIAHNFMSILIHRAGFMSIARYEFYDNIGSMYELCSYYDSGFIMNELCSYISYMTFIMIPNNLLTYFGLLCSGRKSDSHNARLTCNDIDSSQISNTNAK